MKSTAHIGCSHIMTSYFNPLRFQATIVFRMYLQIIQHLIFSQILWEPILKPSQIAKNIYDLRQDWWLGSYL
jgi:hypothetical protein